MILETFKSYVPAKQWLKKHNDDREEFILTLDGSTPPGISYEEQLGGSSRSESERKAILSDEIDLFDKKYRKTIAHCKSTISLCKEWLEFVQPKNRKIFELAFMTEPTTHAEIANKVGYERSWVRRRINEEIELLEDRY